MTAKCIKELKWLLTGGPIYWLSWKIGYLFKKMKYFFQRGFRGYSDEDIYDKMAGHSQQNGFIL